MDIVGQKDAFFFLIRVKGFYSLYFMDGSNLTHKLQLSTILCGKAIKKKRILNGALLAKSPELWTPSFLHLAQKAA